MDAATDAADITRLHMERPTAAEQNISTYERKQFAFVARTLGKDSDNAFARVPHRQVQSR